MAAVARVVESDWVPVQSAHEHRYLDLWEMCLWTYQKQRAHWFLRKGYDWFIQALALSAGPVGDLPRAKVHPDAAAFHAAVVELGEVDALLVVQQALRGEIPERSNSRPRAYPQDVDRSYENYGRAHFDGRLRDYKIAEAERIAVAEPQYEQRGRNRYVHVGDIIRTESIPYCPVDWEPSIEWLTMVNAVHDRWLGNMRQVWGALQGVEFRHHTLTGFEYAALRA